VTGEAPRELFRNLHEMLSFDALGRLEGRAVASVEMRPLQGAYSGVSGNLFARVQTMDAAGEPRTYVLKRTAPSRDIIMRISGDTVCREMRVWQYRLLDRLPPEVGHTIAAVAEDRTEDGGDGWALLMRDIGGLMHPSQYFPERDWGPLSEDELRVFLTGLAAMHARFWEDPALLDPDLGLCDLPWLYGSFTPASAEREAGSSHVLTTWLRDGWRQFHTVASPEVSRLVGALHADNGPLCDALGRYPWTLVHGDPNCKNFGFELAARPGPRILLLDWQFVTRAPPALDLAFFLALFSAALPTSNEAVIEQYRDLLADRLGSRFVEGWWRPQLELALLGQLVRFGAILSVRMTRHADPFVREHYTEVLAWWSERALAARAWL
jgi:hypothetical protein